jgi:histidine ammonia-lyase
MNIHFVTNQHLSIDKLEEILQLNVLLKLSEGSKERIKRCRSYLDVKMGISDEAHYGINTGFGSLCNTIIPNDKLAELQYNLVVSHACGIGAHVPKDIVKLMMLLKIQSLSLGYSGVKDSTVEMLVELYNAGALPVIYEQGSLGASGDLAPLAHLALPLIGMGEIMLDGKLKDSNQVLPQLGLKALTLDSKEGLALLNGTQFMSAYGAYILIQMKRLLEQAELVAALSVDAFYGRKEPFLHHLHNIRPHYGQRQTAAAILEYLEGSEINEKSTKEVQDPYSFRCIPQVIGAVRDAYEHTKRVFETEINSVTDNPVLFPDDDLILSGGNFHGEALAMPLDYLSIALAELGSISERRIYKFMNGHRALPHFLTKESGLNSGFMIVQYTAASIASQNKQLASPASVDSIDSSNGQEDHVSMGANAATKCYKILRNTEKIIAMELLCAAQALEFRRPMKSSPIIEELLAKYRQKVPFLEKDEYMHPHIKNSVSFLRSPL